MRRTALCLIAALWPGLGLAQDPGLPAPASQDELARMRAAVQSGQILSLAEILPGLMDLLPGKLIDVRFQLRDSGPVYVLYDLAPDWQLWIFEVDARTGRLKNPPPGGRLRAKGQS